MNNRKTWIAIKAGFIIGIVLYFFADKTTDTFRLTIRILMLAVFTFSLIRDIKDLQNK